MNVHLKQLILQARYAAPDLAGRASKLSELIIVECSKIMEEKDVFYGEWMGNVIREYFGVKR